MEFKAEQAVLDCGAKIIFAVIEGADNTGENDEWNVLRRNTASLTCIDFTILNADNNVC